MKPYAELLYYNQLNPNTLNARRIRDAFKLREPEDIIEFSGRWDYGEKNAARLGQLSGGIPIIQKYISMGHESMIEMGDATFFIECSRVVSHELVRHRMASYQQESQRFVKYDDVDFDQIFIYPDEIEGGEAGRAMFYAMEAYRNLRDAGIAPQLARYVLPNAMRTRLIMKANVREWRHIIGLRLDTSAQPEMQQLMQQIYDQLVEIYPNALHGVLDRGRQAR